MTVAHDAPLSMGFPRQEYWSGLPLPSPQYLPNPWIEPMSPALTGDVFTIWATWEASPEEGVCVCVCLIAQFSSVAQSCLTLCHPMNRSTPGLPVHHQLPEFIQTQVHRVGDAIQPSHPLSSPSPPAPIPPSIRVFSNESTLHMRWPKYWSFSFSISPSKEIPGLISFRMAWLDLLAVQGLNRSVMSNSLQPLDCNLPGTSVHGDSPGKNTGVGCHALLQGIFPTQGSNSDTLPPESPEWLHLTRRLNFSAVRVALYSVPCTMCFSPSLQYNFPPLPQFFPFIHISHTFGSNSLNRSAHHWVYTIFHPFSKVRVFLNRFDVVCLASDMFQLTITWFGFFLRHQLQTVKYTHPKYVGWKVLIETYTFITNTPIKREHPIISERSLLSLQANHYLSGSNSCSDFYQCNLVLPTQEF